MFRSVLTSLENLVKAAFHKSWKDGKYEWTYALPLLHLLKAHVEENVHPNMQPKAKDLPEIHKPSWWGFSGFGLDKTSWLMRK